MKAVIETRKSNGKKQIEKELGIFDKITKLFEVTQNEAMLATEKREFLLDQRTVREKFVSNFQIGFNFMPQNFPSTSNQAQLHPNQSLPSTSNRSHSQPHSIANEIANASDSDSIDSDDSMSILDFDDSPDFVPSGRVKTMKTPLNHAEIKKLSKCVGSYRTMEKVLSIGIKAAGGDPDQYSISKSSLWGHLSSLRASETSEIREKISSNNDKVIIHFDEKSFPKIN